MHGEDVSVGAIEPGQHEDPVTYVEVAGRGKQAGIEHQPSRRRSLVGLPRGEVAVDEQGLDPADRPELVPGVTHRSGA